MEWLLLVTACPLTIQTVYHHRFRSNCCVSYTLTQHLKSTSASHRRLLVARRPRSSTLRIWDFFRSSHRFVFLPRHAMRKRSLLWPGVRPSVCHVHAFYPDGWRYRQIYLPARYTPIIVVFDPPAPISNSKEEPTPSAGRKLQGVGKFCDFRLKSPSISETVRSNM